MHLHKAIGVYVELLKLERKSEATTRSYRQALEQFVVFLERALGHPPTLADLSLDNARLWQAHLTETQRVKAVTVESYTVILKSFAKRLVTEELLVATPLARLTAPRPDQTVPAQLTLADIALFAELAGGMGMHGRRNRSIVMLLEDSGLRVSELCAIKLSDIRFPGRQDTNGSIRVLGKGRKERVVGFGQKTSKAIALYLTLERKPQDSQWLFPSRTGGHLLAGAVRDVFEYLRARTGIYAHPHAVRHAFGRERAIHGMNLLVLQQQMGHADPKTTRRYAHLAAADLESTYISFIDQPHTKKEREREA